MRSLLLYLCAIFSFLILSSSLRAQSPSPLFVPPSYSGGGQTISADLNGDGIPDLAESDGTILLGNGDGTFTTGTPLNVSGGAVLTGDFNGDGKPDLLFVSFSTSVYVCFGNGDGTFQPPVATNIGTTLTFPAVADANGDGKPDLLGVTSSGLLLVLLGRGDGTFSPGANTYPVNGSFILGDFNGDGKIDVASATGPTGEVQVLLGNGDGTFQTPVNSTGVNGLLAAADFNGDGKLDLLISDSTTGQTYVMLGNGNGTFQSPNSVIPVAGTVFATADVNGDGKPDAIVVTDPFVTVYLGKGDGTFTTSNSYRIGSQGNAEFITTADFNVDGKLDIAIDNAVLLGNGNGSFQGNPAISVNQSGFAAGVTSDFNGDGNPDLVLTSLSNLSDLYVLLGDGTGKFSLAHTYTLPLPAYSLATADFNGDGKLDLAFITIDQITNDWSLDVILGNGDGTFGAPTAFPQGVQGQSPYSIAVADLNGDHIPDLIVLAGSLNVFLGKGDGTFASPVSLFSGSGTSSFVVGDFNNDGIADLAVANQPISGTANIGILLGKGDGTFQPATFLSLSSAAAQLFTVADVNGDGNADLIGSSSGGLQVLLGNGDGTFQTLPTGNQPIRGAVGVADVNLDGKLDLVTGDGLSVLLGNGNGTFQNPIVILPAAGDTSQQTEGRRFVLIADFNHDKRPDVAVDDAGSAAAGVVTFLNISGPPVPDFLVGASAPSPATIAPGSSVSSSVTLTALGGFSEDVSLTCSGLPSGANCSFAPSSFSTGSGTSTLTITTTATTPLGTYPVLIVAKSSTIIHSYAITLTLAASSGPMTVNVAPATVAFAPEPIGTPSAAKSVQVTNTGSAPLTVSVAVIGTNAGDFGQTNTCEPSVAVKATCQIVVTFIPTGMGARTASVSITDNATGSPQMVTLTGSGPDFAVAASGGAGATVTPGQTATYTLSFKPGGGFSGNVALICSGAPTAATCTVSPASIALSGPSAVSATVTVTTTAASQLPVGTRAPDRINIRSAPLLLSLWATVLGLASLYAWRRNPRFRWAPAFAFVLIMSLGLTLTSCGGGSSSSTGGGGAATGTQAGTYTITVSASATSGSTTLTHATNLTLVVQ